MEVLIKKMVDILDDKLTLSQRGILITALLSKGDNPKITLAIFKVNVKYSKIKEDLVYLHKAGYIKWSGYKTALKSMENKKIDPKLIEVVGFMNGLYGRGFDPNSVSTTKNLRNRLSEHSVEDIKLVISNRYLEWKDDPVMKKHLNPGTIFRPSKFDKYLEDARSTHQGESLVNADKIGLTSGDEITISVVDTLIDKDTYTIKTYDAAPDGTKKGNGITSTLYGKDLKRLLILEKNKINNNGLKEFIYIYKNK